MDLYPAVLRRPALVQPTSSLQTSQAPVAERRVLTIAQLLNHVSPPVAHLGLPLRVAPPVPTPRDPALGAAASPSIRGHTSGCASAGVCLRGLVELGHQQQALSRLRAAPDAAIKLLALCRLSQELCALGFDCAQIMAVVIEEEGEQTLAALALDTHHLMAMGFSIQQLIALTAQRKGHRTLAAVVVQGPRLLAAHFSVADLTRMGQAGGASALEAVAHHLQALRAAGFSLAEIAQVGGKIGASSSLRSMLELRQVLDERMLSTSDLVQLARTRNSAGILQAILVYRRAIVSRLGMAVVVGWALEERLSGIDFQGRLIAALTALHGAQGSGAWAHN